MARRKIPRIYEISFDKGPLEGLNVRIKSVKFGTVRRVIRLMDSDGHNDDFMGEIVTLLADSIVSWDLQEEDGTPIEPTLAALEDMEFEEILELANEWLDRITGPGPELGKDSSSGVKSPVPLPTMELL